MSILVLLGVSLGGGIATVLITPEWQRIGTAIGLLAAIAALGVALAMPIDDAVATGGAALVSSGLLRLVGIGWSAGTLVLGTLEVAGRRRVVTGPALLGLGAATLALAVHDPATGFAALGGGGAAAILLPGLAGWRGAGGDPAYLPTVVRGTWATLGSALLGIAVIAWAASPVGPLANGPPVGDPELRAAAGLALLGIVAAIVVRSGLIPAHVWAARFTEGVSPLAVPAALIWGPAAFMLVALDWGKVAVGPNGVGDLERWAIILVGIASIVVGGFAAMLHDDLEHILGYSILQDAGIAVLAFASLHTEAGDAARDWLIAAAALKTALAAWVSAMRTTFGAHRLVDLRGWMRSAPGLAVALGIIWVGAVGVPGMAIFSARLALVDATLSGIPGLVLLVVTLTPVAFLGRMIVNGAGSMSAVVTNAPSARLEWRGGSVAGWSGRSVRKALLALPRELRANRAPLTGYAVVLLAALAFVIAVLGVGA
jgi:NADH-quinone oxidoreductase subunit N